jgi:3-methyladenine DNA glycosylase/8-oxoguanine DNA glycosylase
MRLEEDVPKLELTLALNGNGRTIEIAPGRRGRARISVLGRAPSARAAGELVARARHVLALDEDLSDFYELVADDPELRWTALGAGRMLRAPSVFEDVIKTI